MWRVWIICLLKTARSKFCVRGFQTWHEVASWLQCGRRCSKGPSRLHKCHWQHSFPIADENVLYNEHSISGTKLMARLEHKVIALMDYFGAQVLQTGTGGLRCFCCTLLISKIFLTAEAHCHIFGCDKAFQCLERLAPGLREACSSQVLNWASDLPGYGRRMEVGRVYMELVKDRKTRSALNRWGLHLYCNLFQCSRGLRCPIFALSTRITSCTPRLQTFHRGCCLKCRKGLWRPGTSMEFSHSCEHIDSGSDEVHNQESISRDRFVAIVKFWVRELYLDTTVWGSSTRTRMRCSMRIEYLGKGPC